MGPSIRNLHRWTQSRKVDLGRDHEEASYHVSLQILFLFVLKSLEILEDAGPGVFDVLPADLKGLFELMTCSASLPDFKG